LLGTKSDRRELGTDLRGEIAAVKTDLLVLKWMMGFVLAFQIGIFT
jgi:hypothetical protein